MPKKRYKFFSSERDTQLVPLLIGKIMSWEGIVSPKTTSRAYYLHFYFYIYPIMSQPFFFFF